MNHSRRKRMKNKLGGSSTFICAVMCQEKRNCSKKRKKRAAKTP
jgi:hypothetical protein